MPFMPILPPKNAEVLAHLRQKAGRDLQCPICTSFLSTETSVVRVDLHIGETLTNAIFVECSRCHFELKFVNLANEITFEHTDY